MRYEDFALQLEVRADETCRARVVASPAGEGEGQFKVPVQRAELDLIAARIAGGVERHRRQRRARGHDRGTVTTADPGIAPPELRDVGARLFRSLFGPGVRSRYDHSMGQIAGQPDRGLRIKLQMALDDPATARLHDLPWEYLFQPDDNSFLGLSRGTVIVRYLSLPLSAERPLLPLPLRILAVTAAPPGVEALELDQEMGALHAAWREVPGVEVEHLTHATLDALRQTLLKHEFHVLHFMGHGGVGAAGEGVLCFEDGLGGARVVSGPELAQQLRDFRSLRLVVLNACDSARAVAAAPFTGSATALLQAGVPAVLAMQFPITDEAALAFSEMFYQRLAAGDPVDTAVAEGRLAVQRRLPGTLEWGTPALFLRAPDGRLFQQERPAPATPEVVASEATLVTGAPARGPIKRAYGRWGLGAAAVITLSAALRSGLPFSGGEVPRPLASQATDPKPASPTATTQPPAKAAERPRPRPAGSPGAEPVSSASSAPPELPTLVADPTPNDPQRRDVGFAVVDGDTGWDAQASSVLAGAWAARDADLRHVLMTATFGTRAYFDPLFRGEPSLLGRARLAQQLDSLLLAKKSTEFSSDPELPNVVTARTTVVAHLVDARTGALIASAEAADLGQGGLRSHAERQALERVADTLLEQLR